MSDEYSTLWHVDVDSGEELLGEFGEAHEEVDEEVDKEDEESQEQENESEEDSLKIGVKFQLYLED